MPLSDLSVQLGFWKKSIFKHVFLATFLYFLYRATLMSAIVRTFLINRSMDSSWSNGPKTKNPTELQSMILMASTQSIFRDYMVAELFPQQIDGVRRCMARCIILLKTDNVQIEIIKFVPQKNQLTCFCSFELHWGQLSSSKMMLSTHKSHPTVNFYGVKDVLEAAGVFFLYAKQWRGKSYNQIWAPSHDIAVFTQITYKKKSHSSLREFGIHFYT